MSDGNYFILGSLCLKMASESDLEDDDTFRQIALSNKIAWYCIIDLYIYCRNLQNLGQP